MLRAGIVGCAAALVVALTVGTGSAVAEPFTCSQPAPVGVPVDGSKVFTPQCSAPYSGTVIERHPEHGTLAHEPFGFGALRYTPDPGYAGPDEFAYRATDGAGFETEPIVQQVTVGGDDSAPQCGPTTGTVLVREGTPRTFTLSCSDPDGTTPTIEIVDQPTRGTLSEVTQSYGSFTVTYTVTDPGGPDSFSFRARDAGGRTSETRTWQIDARSATYNTVPECTDQALSARAGEMTLVMPQACTDADGDRLTFEIVDQPSQGTATAFGNSIAYTANVDAAGTDTFTFRADDGFADSATATATITIQPRAVPDCFETSDPVATPDADTRFRLFCRPGGDGLPIDFVIEEGPQHGTLTRDPYNDTTEDYVYRPEPGFRGTDSFTWHGVGPQGLRSESRTFTFAVAEPGNTAPACWPAQSAIVVRQDTTRVARLDCEPPQDGDDYAIEIVSGPDHGRVTDIDDADDGNLRVTYDPDDDYEGRDAFSFRVRDGQGATSATRRIEVDVLRADDNRVPACLATGFIVVPGTTAVFDRLCTDEDQDPLSYEIVEQPDHGVASVSGTDVVYESTDADFNGWDELTFVVRDDHGGERMWTLTIQVGQPPQPRGLVPVAGLDLGAAADAFLPRHSADDGTIELRGARPARLLVLTCGLPCEVEAASELVIGDAEPVDLPVEQLSIAAGDRATLTVALTRRQRAQIAAAGEARVTVSLRVRAADGSLAEGQTTLTLRPR